MTETSSDLLWKSSGVFGYLWKTLEIFRKFLEPSIWNSDKFWKIFRNLQKVVRNLRKTTKKVIMYCENLYNNKNYMVAWRYKISLLVLKIFQE